MPAIGTLLSFTPGTKIVSADVNANFTAIKTWADNSVVMTDVARTISAVHTCSAGLTVSGGTLALAGATVSGAPTWSSAQAITLSTAAQPNITSLGTLTSLTSSGVIKSTGTGAYVGHEVTSGDAMLVIKTTDGSGRQYSWRANSSGEAYLRDDTAAAARLTFASTGAATFGNDITTPGTVVVGGHVSMQSTSPELDWYLTTGGTDEKHWDILPGATTLSFRAVNDANTAANTWLTVTRSGYSIASIAFGVPVLTPASSAAAPAYAFTGDTDTGIFGATDVIGFATGGVERARLDSTGFAMPEKTGLLVGTNGTRYDGITQFQVTRGTTTTLFAVGSSNRAYFIVVSGRNSTTDGFIDVVVVQRYGSLPTTYTLHSQTTVGSPGARTYTVDIANNFQMLITGSAAQFDTNVAVIRMGT